MDLNRSAGSPMTRHSEKPTYEDLEKRIENLEARLSASEDAANHLNKILDCSPSVIYTKDLTGRYTAINKQFEDFSGLKRADVLGKSDFELFPLSVAQHSAQNDKAVIEGKKPVEREEFGPVHGEMHTFISTKYPLISEDGVIYGICGISSDITERKRAEEELSQIFSMSLDMICAADLNTATFLKVNPAFEAVLGYGEEELLEKPFFEFIHPDDIDPTRSIIEKTLRLGGKVINFENRYRRKDGRYRWLSWVSHTNPEKDVIYAVARDVTDWKETRRTLERSKSLLDATGRMARVGGWEVDPLTWEVSWTDETYRIHEVPLGHKPTLEEAVHFFHPEDRESLTEAIRRAAVEGRPYDMEIRFITAKGNHLWTRTICEPKVENGKVVKLRGMFQDITERKRVEQQLQERNLFIQTILDYLPIGLAVNYFDKGTATYMNKRFEEIYGWPEEDLKNIPRFFEKVYPDPEYRQTVQTQILEDIRSGDPDRMQWDDIEVTARNGEKRIVFAKNIPLFEQNFMISTVQDVTAQKRAEAALRTSHERFLKVLNCIDATIYVADMETHEILFMNQHMIETFGRDMTGEICYRVFRGENGPCDHCTNDRLLDENGKPADVHVWQGRNPVTDRWYINYDRAIEWIDGRVVRLQIATDITDFKKMEEELRQAQKMEAIGTLSGGIAHEFNNMLAIILGNAELAMTNIPEWNPASKSIRGIRTASLRAKEVVRKLLSVSRKAPANKKPVRICSIISEALDLLGKTIPATIEIRRRFHCTTETILADATEIQQIMINLCTNAVHAMGDDAGILEVRLKTASLDRDALDRYKHLAPGHYVKLIVADSGVGIPPHILDRVFDPYFTTKEVDQGLGMGLAVVQGIVRKHDGTIAIRSDPGKGTTVEVLFPLIDAQIEPAEQKQESPQPGSGTILFIDDEPVLVELAEQMLKFAGYRVMGMISSLEALETFRVDPHGFDLVVTDMAMPDMPGDRLAREMMHIRPNIPIVLCTGHSDRIDEAKAREAGIQGFMMKPFTYAELTRTVGEAMDSGEHGGGR